MRTLARSSQGPAATSHRGQAAADDRVLRIIYRASSFQALLHNLSHPLSVDRGRLAGGKIEAQRSELTGLQGYCR